MAMSFFFFFLWILDLSSLLIELSPDDVRRMLEERERLESTLQTVIDTKTATQKKVWESEDKLREKVFETLYNGIYI